MFIISSTLITVLTVVVGVILFLSVIMIHEIGHFTFARRFDVKVGEFAIGMGPTIWKKHGKKRGGETVYSIRLLPIGGYCAMEGEDEESDSPRGFNRKKIWQRAIILAAGAIFNILLGFLFMFIVQAQEPYYASNTIDRFIPTAVTEEEYRANPDNPVYFIVEQDGETYYCRQAQSSLTGLEAGDTILSVNGSRIRCFNDAYFDMALDEDGIINFVVLRGGEKVNVNGVVFDRKTNEESGGMATTVLDFRVKPMPRTFSTLMSQTFYESVYFIRSIYVSLFMLLSGRAGLNEMAGPVGIATMIGQVAEAGFSKSFMGGINNMLYIMALITFNLGLFNLLPFPALDGGRLIFLLIEKIRGKRVSAKIESGINFAGLMLLFLLMIIISVNDVSKLFTGCA